MAGFAQPKGIRSRVASTRHAHSTRIAPAAASGSRQDAGEPLKGGAIRVPPGQGPKPQDRPRGTRGRGKTEQPGGCTGEIGQALQRTIRPQTADHGTRSHAGIAERDARFLGHGLFQDRSTARQRHQRSGPCVFRLGRGAFAVRRDVRLPAGWLIAKPGGCARSGDAGAAREMGRWGPGWSLAQRRFECQCSRSARKKQRPLGGRAAHRQWRGHSGATGGTVNGRTGGEG